MTTTKNKALGLAALAAAGLALVGCTATGGEAEAQAEQPEVQRQQVDVQQVTTVELPDQGSYVHATTEELHTLSIDGDDVKVTRGYCEPKHDGRTQATLTPLDHAVGEIGEDGTIAWLDGGAYTDQDASPVDVHSGGNVLLVDGQAFYRQHSGVVEEDSYLHGTDVARAWSLSACGGKA